MEKKGRACGQCRVSPQHNGKLAMAYRRAAESRWQPGDRGGDAGRQFGSRTGEHY